jgi:hypothetical protein
LFVAVSHTFLSNSNRLGKRRVIEAETGIPQLLQTELFQSCCARKESFQLKVATLLTRVGLSNRRAESASSEKGPRGRNLPLQSSSEMGLQLTGLHAVDGDRRELAAVSTLVLIDDLVQVARIRIVDRSPPGATLFDRRLMPDPFHGAVDHNHPRYGRPNGNGNEGELGLIVWSGTAYVSHLGYAST